MSSKSPVLFILLASAAARLAGADVVHTGVVEWRNQPVPGAQVTASRPGQKFVTSTDERGAYRMSLEAGAWTFRIEMAGFQTIERSVDVGATNGQLSWSLDLKPAGSSIEVRPRPETEPTEGVPDAAYLKELTARIVNAHIQALEAFNAAGGFVPETQRPRNPG